MISLFYSINRERLDEVFFGHLLQQLPAFLQEKIFSFQRWQERQQSLLGKCLLLQGLKHLGLNASINNLRFTAKERPYIDDSFDFNISHSGSCVVCVISQNAKVGVDIEKLTAIRVEEFETKFSVEEMAEIMKAENSTRLFYSYWTRKEAFLKAVGEGITVSLDKIKINKDSIRWSGKDWFLREIGLHEDYICHIASDLHPALVEIIKVDFRESTFA